MQFVFKYRITGEYASMYEAVDEETAKAELKEALDGFHSMASEGFVTAELLSVQPAVDVPL